MLSPVASASSAFRLPTTLTLAVCTNSGTAVTIVTATGFQACPRWRRQPCGGRGCESGHRHQQGEPNHFVGSANVATQLFSQWDLCNQPLGNWRRPTDAVVYIVDAICVHGQQRHGHDGCGRHMHASRQSGGRWQLQRCGTSHAKRHHQCNGSRCARGKSNAVASDSQITIDFDPPTNNGGSPITSYTAACGPNGNLVNGAGHALIVTGLPMAAPTTARCTPTMPQAKAQIRICSRASRPS